MEAPIQDNVRELDPFGFWVGYASAIRPLGGEERGPDPRYVFHTPYVEYRPGRVVFTVRFDNLQASFGELRVFINAFVPGSGRDAVFVTSSRLNFADRPALERGLSIPILSVAGATYAAHGVCLEGTDARANGLIITAEQVATADESSAGSMLLPTRLPGIALHAPAKLVADVPSSFGDPVSQAMTGDQIAEPEYQQWLARLSPHPEQDGDRWKLAFVAQALDRYGMLREGAQGIGIGADATGLGRIFASARCTALVAAAGSDSDAAGFAWNGTVCTPIDATPGPDGLMPGEPLSLADQPATDRGFDFLWSVDSAMRGYAAGHCANFLVELMAVLRPGGYAIHLFDLAPPAGEAGDALPRAEVERVALTLISRGFTVAQLNFEGTADARAAVPFGLIVRKD